MNFENATAPSSKTDSLCLKKNRLETAFSVAQALWKDWRFRALFSVTFAAFLMLFMSMQDRYGFTDDDWAISVALSGRYPDSGLCLFVNAAISKVCLALSAALPNINWFIFLEGVGTFVAFSCFTYAMLTYATPLVALFAIAGVQYFFLPSCTYLANFTFITALLTLAGCALLVGRLSVCEGGRRLLSALLGVALCVGGFCLRRDAFLLGMPFLVVMVVHAFVTAKNKRAVLLHCVPFAVLFVLCGVLYAYNAWAWSAPEWAAWEQFNAYRAQISDYGMPPYSEVADTLSAAGINESAYSLATNWCTGLTDFFTVDRMKVLASVSERWNMENVIAAFAAYPAGLTLDSRIVIYFSALAVLCFVLARRWGKLAIGVSVAIAYVCCCYFFGIGRLIDRVEVPVYVYAALCCVFAVGRVWKMPRVFANRVSAARVSRVFVVVGIVGILGLTVHMMRHLIDHFEPEQAAIAVNQKDYSPKDDALYNFAMKSDCLYVWDTISYVVLETAYDHRFLPSEEFMRKNICMGGWTSNAPFIHALWDEVGLSNMAKGLVENDRVRFVTHEKWLADALLGFIRAYYYPDAEMQMTHAQYDVNSNWMFYVYDFSNANALQ